MQTNKVSNKYYDGDKFNTEIKTLNKTNKFALLHLNIRSVPKNLHNLSSYLQCLDMSFDIIGLTETWINETNKNLYNIKKYVHKESFRKVKRGGGVSLYVKEGLSFTEREELSINNSHLESLFIELSWKFTKQQNLD